ncbi:MAG: hypothetical protein RLZZ272_1577, partial [Actinomycetota bacterium]
RQAAALDTTAAIGGPVVAAWWTARLERSAALLAELAEQDPEVLSAGGALDLESGDDGDDARATRGDDERMVVG